MKSYSNFTMLFYTFIFILVGAILLTVSINWITMQGASNVVDIIYTTPQVRIAVGVVGLLILIIGIFVANISWGKMQREKTIGFEKADGQVTISLAAIEDFIKRMASTFPDVKEFKPNVIATKKGINIENRVVLFSDTNIPDITEKIQSILKNRIQDILGIEETISIKIHIAKIVPREEMPGNRPKTKEVTFRGIEYGTD